MKIFASRHNIIRSINYKFLFICLPNKEHIIINFVYLVTFFSYISASNILYKFKHIFSSAYYSSGIIFS